MYTNTVHTVDVELEFEMRGMIYGACKVDVLSENKKTNVKEM